MLSYFIDSYQRVKITSYVSDITRVSIEDMLLGEYGPATALDLVKNKLFASYYSIHMFLMS